MDTPDAPTVVDFITGAPLPDMGAEANRQNFERVLIEEKGYLPEDVAVNVPLVLDVAGAPYHSRVDLVVVIGGRRLMAVKCAAGSLGSREREILAAARLLDTYQIPLSVVTDGRNATLLDTVSGRRLGVGLGAIPDRKQLMDLCDSVSFLPFPEKKRSREAIIFRSYDLENVHVVRK